MPGSGRNRKFTLLLFEYQLDFRGGVTPTFGSGLEKKSAADVAMTRQITRIQLIRQ